MQIVYYRSDCKEKERGAKGSKQGTWERQDKSPLSQPRLQMSEGFPVDARGKNPHANAGDIRDAGLIRGSGRFPGGGNGNHSIQYSCLENSHGQRSPWGCKESDTTEAT